MKDKILNYKFIVLIFFHLVFLIPTVIALFMVPFNGFLFFMFAVLFLSFSVTIYFEPIAYVINTNEIRVICTFKQYCFSYKDIHRIAWEYEFGFDLFELLGIKNYVLILKKRAKIHDSRLRIVKRAKTKKLLEEYYSEKLKRKW